MTDLSEGLVGDLRGAALFGLPAPMSTARILTFLFVGLEAGGFFLTGTTASVVWSNNGYPRSVYAPNPA